MAGVSTRMSRGCYEETASVEFRLKGACPRAHTMSYLSTMPIHETLVFEPVHWHISPPSQYFVMTFGMKSDVNKVQMLRPRVRVPTSRRLGTMPAPSSCDERDRQTDTTVSSIAQPTL